MASLTEIYNWFMTGKKPTQAQFFASWASFWHMDEAIPQSAVSNLTNTLAAKTENTQFNAHKTDADAHQALFDLKQSLTDKGAQGGYAPLDEFTKLAAEYLNIVDDLVTGGSTSLLSAEQGKVLKGQIDAINLILTSDNVNLDNVQELVDAIETIQTSLETILVNDLTTGGITKALTAEMGKSLKALIDGLESSKLSTANISQDIEADKTSTTKVSSVKQIYDWGVGKFKTHILGINTIPGITYAIGLNDYKTKNIFTSSSAVAFTVPTNATTAIPVGVKISYTVQGTGTVTVGGAGITFVQKNLVYTTGDTFFLEKIGSDTWVVDGNPQIAISEPYFNTVIGGIGGYFPTLTDFKGLITKESGSSFTDAEMSAYFLNYKVVGTEIRFVATYNYYLKNNFRGDNASNAKYCTYFYDYAGFVTGLSGSSFRYNTNITAVNFQRLNNGGLDYTFQDCTALVTAFIPKQKTLGYYAFSGCTLLNKVDFTNITSITTSFQYCSNFPTVLDETIFPNLVSISLDTFAYTPITAVYLLKLRTLGNNAFRNASSLNTVYAPNLVTLGTQVFYQSGPMTKLDFPNVTSIGTDNGIYTFNRSTLTLINIPKATSIGVSPSSNSNMFQVSAGCVINVHHTMKTINAGGVHAEIAYAISRGAVINYIDDAPKKIEQTSLSALGTYTDDVAAAAGGVAIGYGYINSTTGALHRRLT